MKTSIEGPSDLNNDLKAVIIDCWKVRKYEKFRCNLVLLIFSQCFLIVFVFNIFLSKCVCILSVDKKKFNNVVKKNQIFYAPLL